MDCKNNTMKNTHSDTQHKVRTTLYLTQENKQRLDRIPRGQKTALMNRAIANALKELEQKENNKKFLVMIADIEPVKAELSSEEMAKLLKAGKRHVAKAKSFGYVTFR
ncbi:MAG: hypothetical protein methR_P2918 [Methyloprofundus sp.]|nr:MAG: hypothetical protein methR_P2918 [Methyloprofundus sp.]